MSTKDEVRALAVRLEALEAMHKQPALVLLGAKGRETREIKRILGEYGSALSRVDIDLDNGATIRLKKGMKVAI